MGEPRSVVLSSNTVTTLASSTEETRNSIEYAFGRLSQSGAGATRFITITGNIYHDAPLANIGANRRHWQSGRCAKPPTEAPSV